MVYLATFVDDMLVDEHRDGGGSLSTLSGRLFVNKLCDVSGMKHFVRIYKSIKQLRIYNTPQNGFNVHNYQRMICVYRVFCFTIIHIKFNISFTSVHAIEKIHLKCRFKIYLHTQL